MHNIAVVDDIVKKTETLFQDFYEDDRTSFIFTADHGMSVIGKAQYGSTRRRSSSCANKVTSQVDKTAISTSYVAKDLLQTV